MKVKKNTSGISGKLKSIVDFHYKICLEGSPVLLVVLREIEIEPNVKFNVCPSFAIWKIG